MALSALLFGVKLPSPPVHAPPVATVTLPLSAMAALFAQSDTSTPAFTTGEGVKFKVMLSLTGLQLPLPVVVSVSVTLPFAISAAVGV